MGKEEGERDGHSVGGPTHWVCPGPVAFPGHDTFMAEPERVLVIGHSNRPVTHKAQDVSVAAVTVAQKQK